MVGSDELHYSDPGASDPATANGMISLSFGKLFEKVFFPFRRLDSRGHWIEKLIPLGTLPRHRAMQCQGL